MLVCGIDPGLNGGIAVYDSEKRKLVFRCKMPNIAKTEVDVVKVAKILYKYKKQNAVVFLEKVQNIRGASSKTTFSFGFNFGLMKGVIGALRMEHYLVHPKTWQSVAWKGVKVKRKKDNAGKESNDTKGTSLIAAKRIFPSESFLPTERSSVPHDGIIDASLIAYFGAKTWKD